MDPKTLQSFQVSELKDRLKQTKAEKSLLETECKKLAEQIRSVPDLRPDIEKRDAILFKYEPPLGKQEDVYLVICRERTEWEQEKARFEGEAKALKLTLEDESKERIAKEREITAMRLEWDAQVKRYFITS